MQDNQELKIIIVFLKRLVECKGSCIEAYSTTTNESRPRCSLLNFKINGCPINCHTLRDMQNSVRVYSSAVRCLDDIMTKYPEEVMEALL